MAIPNQTPYNIFTANGISTVFPYEFYLLNTFDLTVSINGVEQSSGFTISGIGNVDGGEVTFLTPPASGSVILLERVVPTYRLTEYQDNGDLLAETVNKDFDRLWMAIQQAFIYLGLTINRPLLGGPFNARGYRIENVSNPINAQDAATKSYVESEIAISNAGWQAGDDALNHKIDVNFKRVLRVPESSVNQLPPASVRANSLLGWNDQAQPVPIFSMTDTADLAIELASLHGAALIGGLGFLTPEMFGAVGDLNTDDTDAITAAIQKASTSRIKGVRLGQRYSVSRTASFDIPDGVTVFGGGPHTGVVMVDAPDDNLHVIFNLAGRHSTLRDFSIDFNTDGKGSIAAVSIFGVFLQSTSSFCDVINLRINGAYSKSMGFSHGIRCTGRNNNIVKNNIQYCSMGITYRGNGHLIDCNYCNNHFVDENLQTWSPSLPWWDGITGEGAIDCTISNNTTEYNGQSGVYLGGNGSLSYRNRYIKNTIKYNYNRGLDVGVSGTPSATNNVYKLLIEENIILNNRVVGLWAYKANDCIINSNLTEIDSDYSTIWGSFGVTSNRQALAVAGDNCNVAGNRIYATAAENLGYSVSGVGTIFDDTNYVSSGAPNYINDILFNQRFKNYAGKFTPVVGAGSSGIALKSGTGTYVVNDNRATYTLDVLLTGSSAIGSLYLGLLPYISGKIITSQSVTVEGSAFNRNFTNGSQVIGYIPVDAPQQICIARRIGGSIVSDIPSCIDTGTRIRVSVDVSISTTATTDSTPGISFFGHSFLSEQGLANGIGESLGLRVFNFARGGSSSAETALVFGAITHSYKPVGGVIPASGQVELSPQEDAVWYAGAFANVTLAGVQGVINSVSVSGITNKLVFTRSSSGSAVSVPSPVPLIVLPWTRQNSWSTKSLTNHQSFRSDIVIIQCLRNNSSWEQGMADIASIVASLGTDRFVVLPEFPYANETTGTPGANTVNTYNAKLKSAYPNNYCQIGGVDLLGNFNAHYNPSSPQDVVDINNGVTPSSLRYDDLHPSRYVQDGALHAGVRVNAEFICKFIKSKGWA